MNTLYRHSYAAAAVCFCLWLAVVTASTEEGHDSDDGGGQLDLLHTESRTSTIGNHTENDVFITARIEGSNETNRVPADWRPWPRFLMKRGLWIVSHLCNNEDGNWPKALNKARKKWNKVSPHIQLRKVTKAGCNPRVNSDLTYVKNKIKVVYGTCGPDCCGRANVDYMYTADGRIVEYAGLIRFDPSCVDPSDQNSKQYLACHEVGHILGLGHDYGRGSCMGHHTDGRHPGPGDIKTLADHYQGTFAKV